VAVMGVMVVVMVVIIMIMGMMMVVVIMSVVMTVIRTGMGMEVVMRMVMMVMMVMIVHMMMFMRVMIMVIMMVIVARIDMRMAVMVMIMRMEVEGIPSPYTLYQHDKPNHKDKGTGNQAKVAMKHIFSKSQPVGCNLCRYGKKDHTEGMGQGNHQAQDEGVQLCATGANEIGRNHCLSMSWLQCMHTAQHDCC